MAPYRRGDRTMPGLEDAPEGEYLTDRLALEAERFIEKHRDQPFFLNFQHYAVHTPLTAKAELIAKYDPKRKPGQQSNPIYAAMIESVDDSVGRVVRKLQELKLLENTIIVFTSDNGGLCVGEGPNTPATINAPLREGKGYLYEGGIRAPLLISWPAKINAGRKSDAIASTIDLLPTLLELAGVKHEAKIDGSSLADVLLNDGTLKRDAIYWHYPHYSNQGGRPGGAIRRGDYKLIEFYDSGRRELFNVATDIGESKNLALEKPDLVEQLAADLAAWREAVGAQMMTPNPEYLPCPQGPGGAVTMPARLAEVRGQQLRYEPLPHKNTLGFWTQVKDTAHWEFTITRPGKFRFEILQGCGKGSGGSEVEFVITAPDAKSEQRVTATVQDTGGFQEFVRRDIGEVTLMEAGRYQLAVRPLTKPGVAVMDLREVRLAPVK
jgi:arylsulfatase A